MRKFRELAYLSIASLFIAISIQAQDDGKDNLSVKIDAVFAAI